MQHYLGHCFQKIDPNPLEIQLNFLNSAPLDPLNIPLQIERDKFSDIFSCFVYLTKSFERNFENIIIRIV